MYFSTRRNEQRSKGSEEMKKEYTVHLTFNSYAGLIKISFLDEGESKEEVRERWASEELTLNKRKFGCPTKITLRERK
jgi:hypothetical protein